MNAKLRTSGFVRSYEIRTCLKGQFRKWRWRENRKGRLCQQVTSVVSSERLQTRIITMVADRGYGCQRNSRMNHLFIHSLHILLNTRSDQVPTSYGELKTEIRGSLIGGEGEDNLVTASVLKVACHGGENSVASEETREIKENAINRDSQYWRRGQFKGER